MFTHTHTHTQQTLYKSFLKLALFFIFFISTFLFSPFISSAQAAVTYNALADLGYIYTNDGGVFSSNNAANTAFDYFPDDAAVGDILYFGKNGIFDDIQLYIGTAFTADSVTFVWEYRISGAWTTLTVTDGTNNFTNTGQQTVSFVPPTDWRKTTINSQNMNWVRVRITAITNPTEGGANSTQKVQAGNNTIVVTGTETLTSIYNADVAGSWGVVQNLGKAFRVNATLTFGDNSTTTSFTSTNEFLEFLVLTGRSIYLNGSTVTVQFGTLSGTKGVSGSFIYFNEIEAGNVGGFRRLNGSPTLKLYGSLANVSGSQYVAYSATLYLYTTDFLNSSGTVETSLPVTLSYSTFGSLRLSASPSTASNLRITSVFWLTAGGTFENIIAPTITFWQNYPKTSVAYLKNCTFTTKTYDITGSDRGVTAYYQFSFDLKVIDSNGNPISGAAVVMNDKDSTQVFSTTTDVNGDIVQQWATYEKRVKIVSPAEDTDTFYDPHTVTISKSGYETRAIKYTMDRKREEIEVLKAAPAGYVIVPNKGTGIVRVLGTEYGGSESGALYAQVQNQDGTPANGATVTLTVYKSDSTAWVSSQSMTYITGSNGIYKYTFTSPTDVGVYVADVSSTSPTAYGTGEFHVSQWAKNIATSSAQIAGLPSLSDIWSYSTRSLSSFGSLVSDIWLNSTRSLTTFGTLIADIWSYATRTLTESALTAADIWSYATRTLTGATLSSGSLATKTNVDEATQSATLAIKTSNDYDLGDIIGYVDTLETNIGTSSDTASSNTVFGKIKGVQDSVDQLTTIDTNIDTLVSKWGSYSASDIYDKVKNLSSDISAINTVSNVSSILSLAQTNETNVKEVKNKVLAMKAVVDVNRTLLEKVSNQPIIKTWLEEGSIIFKTLITNPSTVATQTVPLKYYLPRELQKEDIIKIDENLKVDYDTSQEAYFASGEFDLTPGETKIITVEVKDIWKISDDEVTSLRKQAEELSKPLKGTSYFAQGTLVKSDIDVSLDKILRIQKAASTPQGRIRAYREAKVEMQIVQGKLDTMKTLVASAGSMGTMFGFIGGVQTLGVWGMIIILIAGFVFLALYIRLISLQSSNVNRSHSKELPRQVKIDFWEPIRPIINTRAIKIGLIILVSALIALFTLTTLVITPKQNQSLVTPATTLTPKEEKSENQEIQVIDEKQVLGTTTSRVKVVVPAGGAVNIRKEQSLTSEVISRFWITKEVVKISEKDDWIQIRISVEKDGVKYSEGWVNKEFIEEISP